MIADGLGYLTHKQGEELLSRTAEVGRPAKWIDEGVSQLSQRPES